MKDASANTLALLAALRANLRESTIFKYALLASSAIFASCLTGLNNLNSYIIVSNVIFNVHIFLFHENSKQKSYSAYF